MELVIFVLFFAFWFAVFLLYVVPWIGRKLTGLKRQVRRNRTSDRTGLRNRSKARGAFDKKESEQANLGEPDVAVYNALEHWRNKTAQGEGVPASVVFKDQALKSIVERKPSTKSELRYIRGVGPRRAERYGAAILSLIAPQKRDRKKEWRQIKKAIKSERIRVLYHFTDQTNLPSIFCGGGLYSWSHCERNGIRISRPGGNQVSRRLDRQRGLEDYVRLSFVRKPPMYHVTKRNGRIPNPVILEVDTEVMLWEQTKFSDGNATANRARVGGRLEDFRRIRFNILRKSDWANEHEKHYWQAEVLVKNHIPLRYINNL